VFKKTSTNKFFYFYQNNALISTKFANLDKKLQSASVIIKYQLWPMM